jgi:hypothetical protein
MSLPSVLIRKSTGELLKRAPYPRADLAPVDGLDPDLEWCIVREPYPAPDYDPRYYSLVTTEQRGAVADATFPHLHPWLITHATQKRAELEIATHVDNKERAELDRHLKEVEQLKILALGVGVLFRRVQGLTLTAKEQAIADRCTALAVKLWQNHARAQEIKTQITAGQEPDLEAGWASE